MDHRDQHHEHHKKEREEKVKEEKSREAAEEKRMLPIHPAWLFAGGFALVAVALAIWTFLM